MKKLLQALFILFSVAALGIAVYYFIQARAQAAEASKPLAMRKLVLSPGESGSDGQQGKADTGLNRIAALPNELILDTLSINLDQDEVDEQILTVRKTDSGGDRLSVVVADYSPSRKAWVRAFEGETLATKFTTFQIQAEDLIGDHNLDIICTGMGDDNSQTMTVFRRIKNQDAEVVAYAPVCAVSADSITIGKVDRSEGYQLGQTNGASLPIYAFSRDKSSDKPLDQVKTTWSWDYRSSAYVQAGVEKIPGAVVEKEMADKILTGVEADFEDFLEGSWSESGKAALDPSARVLVFDRKDKSIVFYSPDAQEDFDWSESHSTRFGIYVSCQNESVLDLRRLMDIELTGADTISVKIFEDLQMKVDNQAVWDGTYRKIPPKASKVEIQAAPAPLPRLDGIWKSADSGLLSIEKQRFSLQSKTLSGKGSILAYMLGKDLIVQLTFLQDSGLEIQRRTYKATYKESKTGKMTTRRLVLAPARATIMGMELLQENELVFDQ